MIPHVNTHDKRHPVIVYNTLAESRRSQVIEDYIAICCPESFGSQYQRLRFRKEKKPELDGLTVESMLAMAMHQMKLRDDGSATIRDAIASIDKALLCLSIHFAEQNSTS